MKKRLTPLSHRVFKKAGYYTTREEAMADLTGTQEEKDRIADARMAGLKINERVKKEGMK